MPKTKRPRDVNQLAAAVVSEAVGDTPKSAPPKIESIEDYAREFARKGGLAGGPARAKKLTAEQRRRIAVKAAKARWGK
jgi:hypothetical protein